MSNTGLLASKAALTLGADIIERHFTLLAANETRDGPVSINQEELQELSNFSKLNDTDKFIKMDDDYPNWRVVIGQQKRQLTNAELLNRDYYRGRFASPREETISGTRMIYNWEGAPL